MAEGGMRQRHNLWIPCEVFTVEVLCAPQRGLSVLERLTLEAIRHGAHNLDLLDSLFQIGHRPMLDLVSDLWRQGHLRVDIYRNRLYVTERVIEEMDKAERAAALASEPAEETLEGGQRSVRSIELVHDLLCHELLPDVFPDRLGSGAGEKRLLQPVLELGSFRHLPAVSLEKAVIRRFEAAEERTSAKGERQRQRLIHFSLGGDVERGASQLRFLQVRIESVCSSTGRHHFQVVEPEFLPPVFRRRLSQRLTAIFEEERAGAAVLEELVSHVRSSDIKPQSFLDDLVAAVDDEVERATGEPQRDAKTASEHHAELRERAADLIAEVEHLDSHLARVRWIRGADGLDQAVTTVLGEAEQRVILSSPVIRWHRLRRIYDLLEKRLQGGLRIIVLWGMTVRSELEVEVRNAFATLSRVGDLQWSYRPMRTQASYLLRDADLGIFTSTALLGDPLSGTLTAVVRHKAVTLDASDDDPETRHQVGAVTDELGRIQRTALDIRIERAVVLPLPSAKERSNIRRLPVLDPGLFEGEAIDTRGGLDAWADSWRRWQRTMHDALVEIGTSATVIHDRQHLDWLETALSGSPRWLVLGGGKVTSRGFDQALQHRLEQLARGGTRIILVDGQRGDFDREVSKTVNALRQKVADHVQPIDIPFRGGVLATERFLLLTSFELLDRAAPPTSDPTRRSLHTGILIRGNEAVRAGLEAWLVDHPKQRALIDLGPIESPGPSPPRPAEEMPTILDTVCRELLEAIRGSGPEEVQPIVERWLQRLPRNLSPLLAFRSVRSTLAPTVATRALASALALVDEPLGEADGPFLLAELSTSFWDDGRAFEALCLFDALEAAGYPGEPSTTPPTVYRRLVTTAGDERFTEAVLALIDSPKIDRHLATACWMLAVEMLAIGTSADAWELAEHVKSQVPDSWKRAVAPLLDFYKATLAPIPRSAFASLRARAASRQEMAERHQAAKFAYENASTTHFNFTLGRLTWRQMFAEDGTFGSLRVAIEAADHAAAGRWLSEWDRRAADCASVMDEVSTQIYRTHDYVHDSLIVHRRRGNYLKRLGTLVDRVRDWVAAEGGDPTNLPSSTLDALRVLSDQWETMIEVLRSSQPTATGWEAPACRALLDLLIGLEHPDGRALGPWSRLWQDHGWRYPILWMADRADLEPERVVHALLHDPSRCPAEAAITAEKVAKDQAQRLTEWLDHGQIGAALRLTRWTDQDLVEFSLRAVAGLRQRRLGVLSRLRRLDPGANPEIAIPSPGSGDEGWRQLIALENELIALEAKAETVLRQEGASQRRPIEPIEALPRLPPWTSESDVAVTVRQLVDRPFSFGGWQPTDSASRRLIDLWSSVLDGGERVDSGWVVDFGEALDRLLGASSPSGGQVERDGTDRLTWLTALPAPWPSPVSIEERGWRLRIPTHFESDAEENERVKAIDGKLTFELYFDPLFDPRRMPDESPEGVLRLHPELLFRTLLGDSTAARRCSWLTSVCSQIPLDLLLLAETSDRGLDFLDTIVPATEPARRLAAFFDLAGFRGWTEAHIHDIVELTGAHGRWLRRYLDALCAWLIEQGRERSALNSTVLGQIWHSDSFRRIVDRDLLALRGDHLDLAYLLVTVAYRWLDGSDRAEVAELEQAVEIPIEVGAGLERLEADGWVCRDPTTDSVLPPSAACSNLLINYALDQGEAIEQESDRRW